MNRSIATAAALATAALAMGACGASTEVNKPVALAPATTSAPASQAAPTTSPPTTAPKGVAHVGATLSLSGTGGEQAAVTLSQVIAPATGTDGPPTDSNGNPSSASYVATVFAVKNTGNQALQGDANNDVSVIGSDGQSYSPDFDNVSECTNFNDGSFALGPAEQVNGCVVFVIPQGVTVAKVQWTPDSGFGSSFGEWLVP